MTDRGGALTRRAVFAAAGGLLAVRWVRAAAPMPIDVPDLALLGGGVMPRAAWAEAPTVVVFFAAYCAFCKRHLPRIDTLYRSGAVRVLGVMLDADVATATRYAQRLDLHFPVTLDDGSLRRRFGARQVVPLTCLVDRASRLLMSIPGEMSDDDVMALPGDLQRLAV